MPTCWPCQRDFSTYHGYQQHMENSAAHRESDEDEEWECIACDRPFSSEHSRHQHHSSAHSHRYCVPCKRMFQNENNLTQHQHSKTHRGSSMQCPFCKDAFTTASGVVIHLESSRCTSGMNRQKINEIIRRLDRNNTITLPMLTLPGYDSGDMMATERAWNGDFYECYLCDREYHTLRALNQHLNSPAHEQNLYRCPKGSCGRQYKALSGLVQHVESETCGVMRFKQVQKLAQGGIENMVGRMIQY